ncbi:MAG: UDP-forming cellulose synthase catalytic subunit [Deltaproteobacteria bacterium]
MTNYINKNLLVISAAIFSTALFLYLSSIYLPLSFQFIVGWGLLIPLFVFKGKHNLLRKIPVRILFLLIAAFISLRYWSWRTSDTLYYLGLVDFIGVMVLYLAESYSILVHLLGMFVNIWPLNRAPVPLPGDENLPTVDIFIPTYTESEEIVHITAVACKQIDYPTDKVNIYILDDGSTVARRNNPETSKLAWERYKNLNMLAEELGISYITREKNEKAKAGNVNNALKHSSGELLLVLDCDHVPTSDILKNTVGLFLKDEKLFLVQTPHFFINPSPVEKNLFTFNDAPMENEMFFSGIQPGLDFWNSAYFCGSAAILKRRYLEEIGGVAGETITEDAETALELHSRGYNSAYVSRPMVCGLSPETFEDFILQRSRWAQGMTQIFILKNPLFKRGLNIYQRICYATSCIFWFFGFTRIVFYLAPLAFIFFGLKIYNASVEQVLAYAVPHVVGTFIVSDFLYGRVRWSFFSELYESVQSIFILPAVLSAILNPRFPSFKITPKGKNIQTQFLSSLSKPFYILLGLILISFPIAAIRWVAEPVDRDVIAICGVWGLYNLIIILACLGVVWEKRYTRRFHRLPIETKARIFFPRLDFSIDGNIKDLSLGGAGILCAAPSKSEFDIERGEEVYVDLEDSYGEEYSFKGRLARTINNRDKIEVGVEYELLEDKETFANLVRFFYGDSSKWNNFREDKLKSIGFWHGFIYFIKKGIYGGMDNFKGLTQNYLKPKLNYLLKAGVKKYQINTAGKG